MIAIIAGTNRRGSRSSTLLAELVPIHQPFHDRVAAIDLVDLPTELFHPDAYEERPAAFTPFVETVQQARGLVFIVPEYNGGPPGALKYFIDMLPRPECLRGKPSCMVGLSAGMRGGVCPVDQLRQVLGYREAHIFSKGVFIPRCHEAIGAHEQALVAGIRRRLLDQAREFSVFVNALVTERMSSAVSS